MRAQVRPAAPPRGSVERMTQAAPPSAGGAAQRPALTRDEDRAWYELARDLRVVVPDAMGASGIDYERAAQRVQCSPASPEDAMLAAAVRGAGHVRRDLVAARLAALPSGTSRKVLVWLRGFGPALEWLAADVVAEKRGALLDALATGSGAATREEAAAWHASPRASAARRQWARDALRGAWALWYGRAW